MPDDLVFRRTTRADLRLLQRWLGTEHVARYWAHETSDEAIERDFGPSIDGTEPSEDFLVHLGPRPLGFIQRSAILDYPDGHRELIRLVPVPEGALTIDYFIGEASLLGRGLGAEMVRRFTELCWAERPDATEIIVPVAVGNRASWSALRSAGYTRIATGILPPDNPVDDGQHVVYARRRPAA